MKKEKKSYRLVVFKGYDLDGIPIRHQKTIHCRTKSEAKTELAKFVAEVENGLVVDGNVPTFAQFVKIWTRDYGMKNKKSSVANFGTILIDYLYKMMVSQFILVPLANGL